MTTVGDIGGYRWRYDGIYRHYNVINNMLLSRKYGNTLAKDQR
jgi:hypothetical protein